ncbi:DUF2937 family protein [Marimonas arenosa]|uniref:DUF2937 family protein n=1 Tax=Marimonas arenosa TaxID=1795305 RepID=A0AAE3WH46_9RHOB|nr:DUF2937 family protein [Marimonas arenosa]MDQ2091513.1 DUF2937 family protein [Marimonas arenosa]
MSKNQEAEQMLLRAITLAGGLAGAAAMSQFPEVSQQYVQRLGGAVDELSRFVTEFNADAAALGLSREEALEDLAQGGAMGAKRAETMGRVLARHERLSADLSALQAVGPFTRAYRVPHLIDREIASKVWAAYKPAVPLTIEGVAFAGLGFLGGVAGMGLILRLLAAPFRRRKPLQAAPAA